MSNQDDRPQLSDDDLDGVAGGTTPTGGIVGTVGVGAIDDAGNASWDANFGDAGEHDTAVANGTEDDSNGPYESDYGYDATQPA